MDQGIVLNIQRYSIQDGPGIRTTVFLKGCPLDCWWCHNPESQALGPEIVWFEGRCVRCGACVDACPNHLPRPGATVPEEGRCLCCGLCVDACPTAARQWAGRPIAPAQVIEDVLRDRVFFEESGGGVTFSGGEPLQQASFLTALLAAARRAGLHTAIDTCGYAPRATLLAAAALADLVLYDLKLMDDARHRRYAGVSNEPILGNLRALGESGARSWIRIPILPGINDAPAELERMAEFIQSVAGVEQVNLLPYHRSGSAKAARLGRPWRLPDLAPPSAAQLAACGALFERYGLPVTIGG